MARSIQGRPFYSPAESYLIFYRAFRTVPYMARGEKKGWMSLELRERLMMAVTEVNGCAMCSWYHTRVALQTGMAEDEVRELLSGEFKAVPDAELTAVLFAQHYADARGKPDRAAWEKLVTQYGKDASVAMLGAIRGIMLGNLLGMPSGSLWSRLGSKRFKKDPRSSLPYELLILLSSVVFMPLALLHAGAARLLGLSVEP
jgi:AhpD family alkylhydroperoxidase